MAKTMRDVLTEQNVKPLTNVNGTPLITYDEQVRVAQESIKDKVDMGLRELNPDGTIAKSLYHNAAINPDKFYDNRFRIVDGELQIVTAQTTDGYRAISDQKNGRVFAKLIPAVVLVRENGRLAFKKNIQVSDTDFVTYFTHTLDEEAMKEVLPVIQSGVSSAPKEKLPI